MSPSPQTAPRRGERGFTVMELTVTLLVLVEIALAALLLFDTSGKLGKAEMQTASMQQGLRVGQYQIVRMVRMAGRGELPVTNNPAATLLANKFVGTAIALRNNVPTDTGIIAGKAPTDPPSALTNPRVLASTDILTVRGVFSTPLYQVNYADAGMFIRNPDGTGRVTISSTSPAGVAQPFDFGRAPGSFEDACGCAANPHPHPLRPEALVLVSPVDDTVYGVAQLTKVTITGTYPNQTAQIDFTTIAPNAGLSTGGVFPTSLKSVAFVGILEEYRYYVREVHATPSDLTSELNPLLSRARFYAGTDDVWMSDPNNLADTTSLYQDIADGVLDLQIALGFDLNNDGLVNDTAAASDEWLFNAPADDPTGAPWTPVTNPLAPLFYVRVNLLARTSRHDPHYIGPLVASIEDHVYNQTPSDPEDPNGSIGLTMRRRLVQTVVGMRNRI